MKRWLWFLVAITVSTSVYFVIRNGLRPKPIPVMNPTDFAEPEQIGAVIYKRLRQNVRAERLVLLGSTPELKDDFRIWIGFLKSATADGEKIVYFARRGMAHVPPHPAWEMIEYDENGLQADGLLQQVQERLKAGQLIVVHGLTKDVSHLNRSSLSRQLDRVSQHPVLSISNWRFAIGQPEQDSLQTQCLGAQDSEGETRLNCAAQKVSRKFQRKNLDPSKTWAIIERHGLKEYLVFVHSP